LARAADDASLTQSGVITGTPLFMAPEQARGAVVDHRSDLFSLGSVLYTLCTGRTPFHARTTLAVLRRVSDDTPEPVEELNPDVPEWLADIIETLHAKDPDDRFQSAGEVAALLRQHLAHLRDPFRAPLPDPVGPRGASGRRRGLRHRLFLVLGLLSTFVATALAVWYATHEPGPARKDNADNGQQTQNEPGAREAQGQREAPGPPVVLSNGSVSHFGFQLTVQANYRLQAGGPPAASRLFLVVRSGGRELCNRPVMLMGNLPLRATFQVIPGPRLDGPLAPRVDGPIEMFIVAEKLVPGQVGFQRETVSNVLTLAP
jgi:hypothetical protein